ncbi:MAG: hypothetical protein MR469_06760 [Campylobacter sp.]|nr:hypothetical protein [Campylobacter sp.]MCI6695322.1 hypothetical protein [Campylobacter sp.]MDY5466224.1 hypothetical protein [Campylobacter sp.]
MALFRGSLRVSKCILFFLFVISVYINESLKSHNYLALWFKNSREF